MMGEFGFHLKPRLSTGWLDGAPRDRYAAGSFLIESWEIDDNRPNPLDHARLTVDGLRGTLTDVFVRATFQDGRRIEGLLRAEDHGFAFGGHDRGDGDRWRYLKLGFDHILGGADHLLFVLGLLIIAGGGWQLVRTISGFTLGHSITLAIATIWRLDLPMSLLNMLVALSILFLAPEILRARQGRTSLTLRQPMIPAFGFGLLHGLGFASGLTSLDLAPSALAQALLLFNLGVEIGQLAFVALILALLRAFRMMEMKWPRILSLTPSWLIGVAGATWLFHYGAAVLEGR